MSKAADGTPLFPAIAIPVEIKSTFECPDDHIDCLREQIGHVSKILIIGWRAGEKHFLELLKKHLRSKVHVQVVSGTDQGAKDTLVQLFNAGVSIMTGETLGHGFTKYAVSREAERFFEP